MTLRNVPQSEWPVFFERFSRQHAGWRASLHGLVAGTPVTRIPSIASRSISIERAASGLVLRLEFVNGVSLCALQPCVVRVQTDDGAARALEVAICTSSSVLSFSGNAMVVLLPRVLARAGWFVHVSHSHLVRRDSRADLLTAFEDFSGRERSRSRSPARRRCHLSARVHRTASA